MGNATQTTKISINFCGFWSSFNKNDNYFINTLKNHFEVTISDNPDFIICSNRSEPFEYMKYDCVRIMFMGENLSPDFTAFDYVIGFDHLNFGDRYCRVPFALFSDELKWWDPKPLDRTEAVKILKAKKYFCNFIYGHRSAHGMREALFESINKVKPVISPGRFLNNMGTTSCSWKEKHDFLTLSKFTIAGDSICYPGFTTEKIVDPFKFHSIPIYSGNPLITQDFNEKSFIYCKEEKDIPKVIDRILELDNNDEAYIEMLTQPPLSHPSLLEKMRNELDEFLINIFSQTPQNAERRIKHFAAQGHCDALNNYRKIYKRTPKLWYTLKEKITK